MSRYSTQSPHSPAPGREWVAWPAAIFGTSLFSAGHAQCYRTSELMQRHRFSYQRSHFCTCWLVEKLPRGARFWNHLSNLQDKKASRKEAVPGGKPLSCQTCEKHRISLWALGQQSWGPGNGATACLITPFPLLYSKLLLQEDWLSALGQT